MTEQKGFLDFDQFTDVADDDVLLGVDVSDTAQSPEGSTKRLTAGQLARLSQSSLIVAASGADSKVKAISHYVCDGDADQVEINQAILDASGKTVLLFGEFTISDSVKLVTGSRVSGVDCRIVLADDYDSTATAVNTQMRTQYFYTAVTTAGELGDRIRNAEIRDVTVVGNEAGQNGPWSYAGILCIHADGMMVINCNSVDAMPSWTDVTEGSRHFCLAVTDADSTLIHGGEYKDAGYEAMAIRQFATNTKVQYCSVEGGGNVAGIQVVNRVNQDETFDGEVREDALGRAGHDTLIFGVRFRRGGNDRPIGLMLHGARGVTVTGRCDFEDCYINGFDGSEDVNIVDNEIRHIGVGAAHAIRCDSSSTVRAPTRRWSISRNRLVSTDGSSEGQLRIEITGACEDVVVSENQIVQNRIASQAIRVDGSVEAGPGRGITIRDNSILAWAFGIRIIQTPSVKIISNSVRGDLTRSIRIDGSHSQFCLIQGNDVETDRMDSVSGANNNTYMNNNVISVTGTKISANATDILIGNRGMVTRSSGVASVGSGNTSIVVAHGLDRQPSQSGISVAASSDLGDASKFWVSDVGSTNFTINVDVDPGASGADFAWSAQSERL